MLQPVPLEAAKETIVPKTVPAHASSSQGMLEAQLDAAHHVSSAFLAIAEMAGEKADGVSVGSRLALP